MFRAFIDHPRNCRFEGQDPNEIILLLLRAHPITNIPWIFVSVILFFIPFFIPYLLPLTGIPLEIFPLRFQIIYLIINYLLVLTLVYEGFLNWYFNATLITNEKVVDIDFEHMLYKGVEFAPLMKIEETDSVTSGIFGTFFNFGNVTIQTAGAKVAIEMKNIPNPTVVSDIILDLAKKPHEHILGVPHI